MNTNNSNTQYFFTGYWALAKRLHIDQSGASYSISVVLVLPTLVLFIAFIVELAMLLHSGHAFRASMQTAQRSVRCWLPHRDALNDDGLTIERMVHACVTRNLMPFVVTKLDAHSRFDAHLARAIRECGLSSFASQRYAKKHAFIASHLRVRVWPERRDGDGYVVRVEYDAPLWLPISWPLLATGRNGGQHVRTLTDEAWVPVASGETRLRNLGIPYSPSQCTHW